MAEKKTRLRAAKTPDALQHQQHIHRMIEEAQQLPYLTEEHVCCLWQIDPSTFRRWVKAHADLIKPLRFGARTPRYSKAEVLQALRQPQS